jgi:entericidin A
MSAIFKENPMKPMIAVLIAAALTLAGCNTMKGFGQDVEHAGSAIEKAGSK